MKKSNQPGNLPRNQRMHLRFRTQAKLKLTRRFAIVASLVFIVSGISLFLFFNLAPKQKVYGAVSGDYRSIATGNWNSTSTWQTYNGTSWVAASSTPTSSAGAIQIQSPNIVTVTSDVSADQITVDAGATIIISSGKKIGLDNGTGTDLTINGTLNINGTLEAKSNSSTVVNGTVTLASGGKNNFASGATIAINTGGKYHSQDASFTATAGIWTVNSGAIYQHDVDGGSLPLATWNTGSTCEITGVVATAPSNLSQNFHHFTWNNPGQTSVENFSGALTNIGGDFNMISTGHTSVRLGQTENYSLSVGGNFNMQGGNLFACTKATSPAITVSGNYNQTGGTFGGTDISLAADKAAGNLTINVHGNFIISGGTFDMTQNASPIAGQGITTLNLKGNYMQTGGTVTETAAISSANNGYGTTNFIKSGTQTFSKTSGTISNNINFIVSNTSTLDLGTSIITGSGFVSLPSGSGLTISSPDGITASGATGNIQVTGTRSFSSAATYTYNGTSAQVTGNGLPATVSNLVINNTSNVTLTNTVSVSGTLTLANGYVTTGVRELIVTNPAPGSISWHSPSCYVNGNLRRYVNTTGSYDFPVGSSANYETANINLNSATGFTNILGTFTNASPINPFYPLTGITVNGTTVDTMLNYGYWTMTPNLAMTSGNYSITISEKGHTNPAGTPASYCVLKRVNATSSWQSLGTHTNSTQTEIGGVATAKRSGLTSFSQFGIGKNRGIGGLPITLIYFNAKVDNDAVDLTWATANEINNELFTVERSSNGIFFEAITTKPGAGNSTSTIYYSAVDSKPLPGYSYYRLKQTDYDGHFTYSPIKTVRLKSYAVEESVLKINTVAPNPFIDKFTLSFTMQAAAEVDFRLINSSGQVVYSDVVKSTEGINEFDFIDARGLPKGVYYLNLVYNNEKQVRKIVKD